MKLYVVVEKSVQLGFTRVRELVRVGRKEVGKLGRGRLGLLGKAPRLDLFGSAPQAPPSRSLPRDPARRPRRGTTVPSSLRLAAFLTDSTVLRAPVTVPLELWVEERAEVELGLSRYELVGNPLEMVGTKSSLELVETESPLELVETENPLELVRTESPIELIETESPLELVEQCYSVKSV
ncbi:hypothetical protein B296_00003492 [Ensete ventricosum]|uniref:Uncharacterized protein n=1 Tax=Ensete ventricosum TaxID=4639 RepID=A0A427AR23_ENSVE|nr:hypothetical protein B296_00003492 [Ensete ventricosum]